MTQWQQQRVLLVEDDADDVELTVLAFAQLSPEPQLLVAKDGVEALRLLHGAAGEAIPEPAPDLVLLDVNLPLLDGHKVLQRIRANPLTRRLPIVMLTSSREERDIEKSYRLGANGYVQKPIGLDEFVLAARSICDYWLSLNLAPDLGTTDDR